MVNITFWLKFNTNTSFFFLYNLEKKIKTYFIIHKNKKLLLKNIFKKSIVTDETFLVKKYYFLTINYNFINSTLLFNNEPSLRKNKYFICFLHINKLFNYFFFKYKIIFFFLINNFFFFNNFYKFRVGSTFKKSFNQLTILRLKKNYSNLFNFNINYV